MGLFDKFFSSENKAANFNFVPTNEMDAWVGIFYACAGVDGNVSEIEADMMSNCLVFKSWFDTSDTENMMRPYRQAISAIQAVGSNAIIDSCVPFISEDRKNTLFCFIVEVLTADSILHDSEKNILEYLQNSLHISDDVAMKILDVYFMRNYGNLILHD